jgi:hypothetical protein
MLMKLEVAGSNKMEIIHSSVQKNCDTKWYSYVMENLSPTLVGVALLEHALLGLFVLALASVATQLRQRVRFRTNQECLLCRLHVLRASLPRLQHRVLEGPSIGERHVPRVRRLVHRIQIQSRLHLRLSTGKELQEKLKISYVTDTCDYMWEV